MMGPPCGAESGFLISLKYRNLFAEDLADWEYWVNKLGADRFLYEIIELWAQCAQGSHEAIGYFLTPGLEIQRK